MNIHTIGDRIHSPSKSTILVIKNHIQKSFGPAGSWAGYTLMIAGIVTLYSSLFGILLILAGVFMGFTSTLAIIDVEAKRIKFDELLFGIIPTGRWVGIRPDMTIGIKSLNIKWVSYSWSNREFDFDQKRNQIVLFDPLGKEIGIIAVTNSLEKALNERDIFCRKLEIGSFEAGNYP